MTMRIKVLRVAACSLLMAYFSTVGRLVHSSLKVEEEIRSGFVPNDFQTKEPPNSQRNVTGSDTPRQQADAILPSATPKHLKPWKSKKENSTKLKRLPDNFVPKVYRAGPWDNAPIVVEEFKLLFFTQGKVACTEFKKLLRRMMHLKDWRVHSEPNIPHNPRFNGLKYLYHYSLPRARQMLTDPTWTRAIFVRDPKERFLSAYLDKAAKKDGLYVDRHCCLADIHKGNSCGKHASRSLLDFTKIVRDRCCCDPHWKPQSWRIDKELWDHVNFVGKFDLLAEDTKRMLEELGHGAWEKFGASGWGEFHNESAFVQSSTAKHRTSARNKMMKYFNDSVTEEMIDDFFSDDYKRFKFTRYRLADP